MNPIDREFVIWFNGLSGNVGFIDDMARIIATDYLMPMVFSLAMFGMWFAGRTNEERERFQHWVLIGISSIGLSNVAVVLFNVAWDRDRPYVALPEIELLFYKVEPLAPGRESR